jgi:hypothetical protein
MRQAVMNDPALQAARDGVKTLSARRADVQQRFDALHREYNLDPSQRERSQLRVKREREDAIIELQEIDRELKAASAECATAAERCWREKVEPLYRELRLNAIQALNDALAVAAARNRALQELEGMADAVRPREFYRPPAFTCCWTQLAKLPDWRAFVEQELGLKLEAAESP